MPIGLHIVVAEVHAGLLDVTVKLLRLQGHVVLGISALPEATAAVPPGPVDLLILGWTHPEGEVVPFLRRFRAAHPTALVVITTADGHSAVSGGGAQGLADLWLVLPADTAQLWAIVARLAAGHGRDGPDA